MVVCNKIVVMALENAHIIRLDEANPSDLEEISEIARKSPGVPIHKVSYTSPEEMLYFIIFDSFTPRRRLPDSRGRLCRSSLIPLDAIFLFPWNQVLSMRPLLKQVRGMLLA